MLILDRGVVRPDRPTTSTSSARSSWARSGRSSSTSRRRKGKPLNRYRPGRFTGRIWVEDQDYHIVRYNGIYASSLAANFHFDSWRMNVAPGAVASGLRLHRGERQDLAPART